MARNSLAGKSTGTSKSAKYFASHPEARKKKNEYNAFMIRSAVGRNRADSTGMLNEILNRWGHMPF